MSIYRTTLYSIVMLSCSVLGKPFTGRVGHSGRQLQGAVPVQHTAAVSSLRSNILPPSSVAAIPHPVGEMGTVSNSGIGTVWKGLKKITKASDKPALQAGGESRN
jgi:hypothetical protein